MSTIDAILYQDTVTDPTMLKAIILTESKINKP